MKSEYSGRLAELARLFLKLGAAAFGGPAAHIAMMEDEIVNRRRWLSRQEFLDFLGATNLIPGPNSTEMAIHIGHRRAGWAGLIVAGGSFILPAFLIVLAISWAYVRFGSMPEAAAVLYGVKPVVIAIILQAVWRLARSAFKSRLLAITGVAAAVAGALGVNELAVLFGTGIFVALLKSLFSGNLTKAAALAYALRPVIPTAGAAISFGLWPMFLIFVKIGSIIFGSGYLLVVFLRADFVDRLHWLTEGQLLDAIAVGQVTPGPVFTAATFIGFLLSGFPGAVAATAGIFLPAFFFVAVSGPLVPRLRRSPTASAFLDGVNAASVALMAVVTVQLAGAAFVDYATIGLGIIAAVLLLRYNLNTVWLVLGAVVAGITIHATGFSP